MEFKKRVRVLKKIVIHNNLFNTPRGFFGKLKKILKPMNFGGYVIELDSYNSDVELYRNLGTKFNNTLYGI